MKFGLIKNLSNKVTVLAGKTGLKIAKHSPAILMVAGTALVVTGTVMACKGSLKLDDILDDAKTDLTRIKEFKNGDVEGAVEYTEADRKSDIQKVYVNTSLEIAKSFGPAVIFIASGIFCFLAANRILSKRNAALMAAYSALNNTFAKYRERVRTEAGPDKDIHYMYGTGKKIDVIEETKDENGNTVQTKTSLPKVDDADNLSMYSRVFDDSNDYWKETDFYNKWFLSQQQNYANDLLNIRGYLTLNEVYELLGFPATEYGLVVGWVKHSTGDGYVDFGITDVARDSEHDGGYKKNYILDFNVDGVIFDKV